VDLPSYKMVDLSIVFRMFTRGYLLQHQKLTGAKRREFSGMIHWLTINNNSGNRQQPMHSLRLAPVRKKNMSKSYGRFLK